VTVDKTELHSKTSAAGLRAIVDPMEKDGASWSEIMVVLESVVLGVILYNERRHDVNRRVSSELLESMHNGVIERLAKK
jgi:hypothetical protein